MNIQPMSPAAVERALAVGLEKLITGMGGVEEITCQTEGPLRRRATTSALGGVTGCEPCSHAPISPSGSLMGK